MVQAIADPRLKILRQSNLGQGAARNTAIVESKGAWAAFLDADDAWSPNHLAELAHLADSFPDAGLIATRSFMKDSRLDPIFGDSKGQFKRYFIDYFRAAAADISVVHTSAAAISRVAFRQVGLFGNYPAGQDLEMWARVALEYPCAISEKPTSIYFQSTGGVMDSLVKKTYMAKPCIMTLEELSPSVATLVARMGSITADRALYKSVVSYIDSRVENAMRGAFVSGDIRRVKQLRTLLQSKHWPFDRWRYFSALPSPVLGAIASVRSALKYVYTWASE